MKVWITKKARKKIRKLVAKSDFGSNLLEIKYFFDKRKLPLKKEHKALYKNIHRQFYWELERFPDLVGCQDYNDKIQWLKLFDQDPLLIQCCDKLGVRDYVREVIGDQYLPKVYQSAERFSAIDFDKLPNCFVIKTNHDSGSVILVADKTCVDKEAISKRINASLRHKYGVDSGEWPYFYIEPKVFVEQFIGDSNNISPKADYKFHCVDGTVRWLQFIYDRAAAAKEVIVDDKGVPMGVQLDHNMIYSEEFVCPDQWLELVDVAEKLSKPFKYVRVDLFLEKGRIYTGELTFFPFKGCYKGDGQLILSSQLDFDRVKVKPVVALDV